MMFKNSPNPNKQTPSAREKAIRRNNRSGALSTWAALAISIIALTEKSPIESLLDTVDVLARVTKIKLSNHSFAPTNDTAPTEPPLTPTISIEELYAQSTRDNKSDTNPLQIKPVRIGTIPGDIRAMLARIDSSSVGYAYSGPITIPFKPEPIALGPLASRIEVVTDPLDKMAKRVALPEIIPNPKDVSTEHFKRYMADLLAVYKEKRGGNITKSEYRGFYRFADKYGIDIDDLATTRKTIYSNKVLRVTDLSESNQTKLIPRVKSLLAGMRKFYEAHLNSKFLDANNIPKKYTTDHIDIDLKTGEHSGVRICADGFKKPNYKDASRQAKTAYMGLSGTDHFYIVVPGKLESKYPLGTEVKVTAVINGVERSAYAIAGEIGPYHAKFGEMSVALAFHLGLATGTKDQSNVPKTLTSLTYDISDKPITLFDTRIHAPRYMADFLVTGNEDFLAQGGENDELLKSSEMFILAPPYK